MRPSFAFPAPQPSGPMIDGLEVREFRLLVPADGPAGITVRWVWTTAGAVVDDEQAMALRDADAGDLTTLSTDLVAWLYDRLVASRRMPADAVAQTSTIRQPVEVVAPDVPVGRLG